MAAIFDLFRRSAGALPAFKPGSYHYQSPAQDERNYRLHLRVEEGGLGVLIVNAATVLHLNETAAEYAFYFVHNQPAGAVGRQMAKKYQVEASQAEHDYTELVDSILTLVEVPDLDPVTYLDFDRRQPYSSKLSAPYRLDLALTYRLPEGAAAEAAPQERVRAELSAADWKTALERAWQAGIPHVVFTGGEPTLRPDLPELVAHAEKLGLVSGLYTSGERLADPAYLELLLQTGLDHLMVVLHPEQPAAWQALRNALPQDISVTVHLTLTNDNRAELATHLEELKQMGVAAVSLTSTAADLELELQGLRDQAADLDLRLVWDVPVPYSDLNPVALELEKAEKPQGAGRAWLYVEPDGDVLPGQGVNEPLGNLLNDPWDLIWKNAQAKAR